MCLVWKLVNVKIKIRKEACHEIIRKQQQNILPLNLLNHTKKMKSSDNIE
jgi:hypothetical protein